MRGRVEGKRPKRQARGGTGISVGVTELAWIYDRSRDWARALLERWEDEQLLGKGPIRVIRTGRLLHTTMTVIHANLPPGKDLALYRRMEDVEGAVTQAHQRIDRLNAEHTALSRRVGAMEGGRPMARRI